VNTTKYVRFNTEDELLKHILRILPHSAYPRVSAIGGKKITPDIDILAIERTPEGQPKLIGYEVKLMKFNKKSKGLRWISFYSGIGQALLHLLHGVNQVVIVLGFHVNVPDDRLIDEFRDWLYDNRGSLKRILGGYISVGLLLYENRISEIIEGGANFYPPDEKIRLLSEELIQGKFTYNKRLLKND